MALEDGSGDSENKSTASRDRVAGPANKASVTQTTENGEEKVSPSTQPPPSLAEGGTGEDYSPQEGKAMAATIQEKESGEAEEKRALSSPLANTHVDGHTATGSATTTTAALPPLEASIMHAKLEGTASREKRQKQEKRLAKKAPPSDPPEHADLARRRGGLGGWGGSTCWEISAGVVSGETYD